MIRVLFICSGNICRSPMADAVFQDIVDKANLGDKLQIDSAGTGGWHVGQRPHNGTLKILKEHNISYRGRARQMEPRDLKTFNYILAMDKSHLSHINRLGETTNEVALFLSYANSAQLTSTLEVPDPYYDGRFQLVYDLVEKGSSALLDHIKKTHHL